MINRLLERLARRLDRLYLTTNERLGGRITLVYRTALSFSHDDGPAMAASVAYYALFSFFPLLLLLIAVGTSLLNEEEARRAALSVVARYLPGALDLANRNLQEILQQRNAIGALAVVALFWASSGVFGAVYRSVNRAWGRKQPGPFWEGRLFAVAMTISIGLGFFLYMAVTVSWTIVQSWRLPVLGWQPFLDPDLARLLGWLSALVSTLITVAIFTLIYRLLPRANVAWRDVWPASLVAGLAWQAARQLFTWYLSYARYNVIYGSLGAIIAFLLWSYLSALILLLGAEFTAEYARWRRAGRPVDNRLPRQVREEWL